MKLEINNNYNGFKLISIENVDEIKSQTFLFEHEKTKAKLIFLKNESVDKTFSITFKTPPYDNTGLPHILEHSVLCGSTNYPLKDPFAQIAKSTINTFVNAFTFPDKTMYPFSTTNNQEYKKIMRVYLDAVFYPKIYDNKEIFLQEGWRYELNNESDELKYSGVVYGEMKGALSSPNRILSSYSQRVLFPDNCYGVESGGDPEYITDLKYEEFLEFHKKYYHPTNSFIYLYGDLDILDELKIIDEEYLSKFQFEKEYIHSITPQKDKIKNIQKTIQYPISTKENIENKYLFGLNFVIDKATNYELMLGFEILSLILMEFENSPLKTKLFESKICDDVNGGFSEELILEPIFDIVIENTNIKNLDKFKSLVFDTLKDLVEKGIDKDLIKGAINKKEFTLKEGKFFSDNMPKGILTNIKIMDSWLYDSDPLGHIRYSNFLENIKDNVDYRYFEKLIEKYLINSEHNALIILEPNPQIDFEKDSAEKLKKYKSTLSKEELQRIINQTKKIEEFQNKEDKIEDIEKIKVLNIEDIDKKPKLNDYKIINHNEIEIIEYKKDTNGIDYFNLYFDATKISQEKIQYITLLSAIIEESPTKNYSLDDFINLINIYTGGFNISLEGFEDLENNLKPKFVINTKILSSNYDKLVLILNEIFDNMVFEENKIEEVIKKTKSRIENAIINSAHIYTAQRIDSYNSNSGMYNELTKGIEFYKFIKELDTNFKDKKDEIIKNINEVYNLIFDRDKLIFNVCSNNFDLEEINKLNLKNKNNKSNKYEFELKKLNEGFLTSSNVNYVGIGYNLKLLNSIYDGSFQVLKNILRYDFLWDNIRVKGGAYGALAKITRSSIFDLVSYRDPNLKKTYQIYNKLPNYLKNLNLSEEEIRKHIIGAISDFDKPLTLEFETQKISIQHIQKIDYKYLEKEREEILKTDLDKLKELEKITREIMDKNYRCTIGNSNLIKKEKEEFENIVDIFN